MKKRAIVQQGVATSWLRIFVAGKEESRKGCYRARISRRLRLLRAHGVIHKISKTPRYRLTERGQLPTASLFAAREASVKQLLAKAS